MGPAYQLVGMWVVGGMLLGYLYSHICVDVFPVLLLTHHRVKLPCHVVTSYLELTFAKAVTSFHNGAQFLNILACTVYVCVCIACVCM